MNNRLFIKLIKQLLLHLGIITGIVVFFTTFSGLCWAIGNPVGSGRVPPSHRRGGLIRSPNPIDTSGNLVITGNVGRGKHFRGVVPYQATSDFWGDTSSHPLHSFLRRSASSKDFGKPTGRYRPYYSPIRTITTIKPGQSGVFTPPTAKIRWHAVDSSALPLLPKKRDLSVPSTVVSNIKLRPMSLTPQEMEKAISSKIKKITAEQYEAHKKQYQHELQQISNKASELKQSLEISDNSLQQLTEKKVKEETQQQSETSSPKEKTDNDGKLDVFEQMRQQIDDLQDVFEQLSDNKQTKTVADGNETSNKGIFQKETSPAGELTGVELSTKAKTILGKHKTFVSFSKDKFDEHLRAGEEYLKQGKYYLAADTYTLASIYKPDNPLAYAGKSYALFAAGEYMSSSFFLSRAIEIFPEYAQFKIDLVAMVGNRDKLESRIIDVEKRLGKNNSAELQFLLSYIYYQIDRLERARKTIDAAYEKMPESSSVAVLKKVIGNSHK